MLDACIILSRLNIDLFAMATRSVSDAWELLAPATFWSCRTSIPGNPDLSILGLDQMPLLEADLRQAYRRAAKASHPDAAGSADAFRAVADAFRRLAGSAPCVTDKA
jgi:hypothetical protein